MQSEFWNEFKFKKTVWCATNHNEQRYQKAINSMPSYTKFSSKCLQYFEQTSNIIRTCLNKDIKCFIYIGRTLKLKFNRKCTQRNILILDSWSYILPSQIHFYLNFKFTKTNTYSISHSFIVWRCILIRLLT